MTSRVHSNAAMSFDKCIVIVGSQNHLDNSSEQSRGQRHRSRGKRTISNTDVELNQTLLITCSIVNRRGKPSYRTGDLSYFVRPGSRQIHIDR